MDKQSKKKLSRKEVIERITELIDILDKKVISKAKKKPPVKKTEKTKSIDNLDESLTFLRVAIKYTIFDLEATQRENKYYIKVLKENGIEL